jgi:hypothetical protein
MSYLPFDGSGDGGGGSGGGVCDPFSFYIGPVLGIELQIFTLEETGICIP